MLVATACNNSNNGTGEITKKEVQKDVLVVSELYEGSSITAFEQDLIKEIGKENNWNVKVENTPWDDLFKKMENKKADMSISGITITDERKKTYDFSDSYFKAYQLALVKNTEKTNSLKALSDTGKKIAVQKETTAVFFLKDLLGNKYATSVIEYDSFDKGVADFFAGKVDAFVGDNAIILDYLKKNKKDGYKLLKDPKAPVEEWGIMLPKGSDFTKDVNKAINKLKDNGKYDEIYNKYFAE
jgi:polar amino acid transport system substrate-binding protein